MDLNTVRDLSQPIEQPRHGVWDITKGCPWDIAGLPVKKAQFIVSYGNLNYTGCDADRDKAQIWLTHGGGVVIHKQNGAKYFVGVGNVQWAELL